MGVLKRKKEKNLPYRTLGESSSAEKKTDLKSVNTPQEIGDLL